MKLTARFAALAHTAAALVTTAAPAHATGESTPQHGAGVGVVVDDEDGDALKMLLAHHIALLDHYQARARRGKHKSAVSGRAPR